MDKVYRAVVHQSTTRLVLQKYLTYGVFCQVRLNQRYYDETSFLDAGIAHEEAYFLDGTVPPPHVLYKFIAVCEATSGAVAVHCKVGLKCDAPSIFKFPITLPCRPAWQIMCPS